MSSTRSLPRKAVLALTVSVALLSLVELVLRAALPVERLQFQWERADAIMEIDDAHLLEIRPSECYEGDDGPYHWKKCTNDQNIREEEHIPEAIPAGTRRYLALGDSWVFGWSLDQGETFPDALEELLPERLGVEHVEVVNGGKPTATTLDMLTIWHRLSAIMDLHGVILGTSHNLQQLAWDPGLRHSVYSRIHGAPFVNLRLYLALRRLIVPCSRPTYASFEQAHARRNVREMMTDDMVQIATEARGEGLPVWFVNMPDLWDTPVGLRRSWAPYRAALEEQGVLVTGHSLEQRSCWGFEDKGHPSEAGAWALASVTADLMIEGVSDPQPRREPSCDELPGAGPGKAGW